MEGEEEVSTFETRRKPVVATSLKMAVPLSVNHKKILPLRGAITFQGGWGGAWQGRVMAILQQCYQGEILFLLHTLFVLSLPENDTVKSNFSMMIQKKS